MNFKPGIFANAQKPELRALRERGWRHCLAVGAFREQALKSVPMVTHDKIRILVADDHPVVRQGVIANVKPQRDMMIAAAAEDGIEALA